MIITATNTCPGILDLSSLERLQEGNLQESKPFRVTIRRGQSITVDDQWYFIRNIQTALKAGYITISNYTHQDTFSQEIPTPETTTPNFNLTKVEILNRSDYPQQALIKYNANMDIIDANLGGGGGGGTWGSITGTLSDQTDLQLELNDKANVSGQIFTGNVYATNLSNINTGDQDLTPYLTQSNASTIYLTQANAALTYLTVEVDPIFTASNAFGITSNDLMVLANTSGINTGNQDLTPYLTISNASSTYLTQNNASSTYLTISNAASTYLTSSNISDSVYSDSWDGVTTIAPSKNAVYDKIETLLPSSNASSTYLTISNASSTYLTVSNAASYALLDGSNQPFTGNINISKASPEFRLTDTGSSYMRQLRTPTTNYGYQYNQVTVQAGAFAFNSGTSVYVNVPANAAFQSTTGSWAWWSKENSSGNGRAAVISLTDGTSSNNYGIWAMWGYIGCKVTDVNAMYIARPATDANWHHHVVTFSGTNPIKYYVDGALYGQGTPPATWAFSNNVLRLGSAVSVYLPQACIAMDDVRIYNVVLSAGDVSSIYNSGSGTESETGSLGTGLVAHYTLNENSANTIVSDVKGGYNGTASANTSTLTTAGKVASGVQEATIWSSKDGVLAAEKGIQTFGDAAGRTVIEGRTTRFNNAGSEVGNLSSTGLFLGDSTTATARLHLKAGSATASTAPLKFNSGTLLTAAEAGAVEFLTDKFYGTITTGAARKELALMDAAGTVGSVYFAGTNGRITQDNANFFWDDTNNRLGIGTAAPSAKLEVSAASPEFRITDTGSSYMRQLRTPTTNLGYQYNRVVVTPNNTAVNISGSTMGITTPDTADLSFTNGSGTDSAFSISAWINLSDIGGTRYIVSKDGSSNPNREWIFRVGGGFGNGKISLNLYDSSGNTKGRYYNTALTTSTWYHVVATYSGNNSDTGIKIYVNGTRVDDTDTSNVTYNGMSNGSSAVVIGNRAALDSGGLTGTIDEVVIFSKELTSGNVTTLYNSGTGVYGTLGVAPYDSNVIAAWHLDENTGTSAVDFSGNNHTGTLNNSPTWVAGKISSGTTTQEPIVWSSKDSPTANEKGIQTFGDSAGRTVIDGLTQRFNISGSEVGNLSSTGLFLGDSTTATARLHLKAGSATASTAPLKFNSGTLLTSAEAGAVEFLTDKFYGTITTGAARKELALMDAAGTAGSVYFAGTNGRITQDNANFFWDDTNNRLGIGTASPGYKLDVQATDSTAATVVTRFSNDASGGLNWLRKSRGATVGTQTIVQNNDVLGNQLWQGSDGTDFRTAAVISAAVDGTPGASDMPGRLMFWTTPDGSATQLERMRIDSSGNVGIGTTAPATRLDLGASLTTNSLLKAGSMEIQSYSTNNTWFADNIYFDGTNFKYRATGFGTLFYLEAGGFETRTTPSGTAGATATLTKRFAVAQDGGIALGGTITGIGDFTGASAIVNSTGNMGIGTGTTISARLHSLSTTEQLRLGYDASNYLSTTVSSTGQTTVANITQDVDYLVTVNDGGVTRTAIQVNGTEGSVTMPRQSYVKAIMINTQTIAHNTETTVIFPTESVDVLGEYDPTTGIFTAKNDGVYQVNTSVNWANTNANTTYFLKIVDSGAGTTAWTLTNSSATATYLSQPTSSCVKLTAGQTIKITVFQWSGGNEVIGETGGYWNYLTITKVS